LVTRGFYTRAYAFRDAGISAANRPTPEKLAKQDLTRREKTIMDENPDAQAWESTSKVARNDRYFAILIGVTLPKRGFPS